MAKSDIRTYWSATLGRFVTIPDDTTLPMIRLGRNTLGEEYFHDAQGQAYRYEPVLERMMPVQLGNGVFADAMARNLREQEAR